MDKELVLLQLLGSRLCHDLIGPAGSLNFSIDMLKEEKGVENKEAFDILSSSVSSLVGRLNYFRIALGLASISEKEAGIAKLRELIEDLFKEKECKINWDVDLNEILLNVANSNNLKLVLNIFLVIFYTVQKAVVIKVLVADMGNKVGMAIAIRGSSAKLGIDNMQALRLELLPNELTPRNVQSYFTAMMAKKLEAELDVKDNMREEIHFAFILHASV